MMQSNNKGIPKLLRNSNKSITDNCCPIILLIFANYIGFSLFKTQQIE